MNGCNRMRWIWGEICMKTNFILWIGQIWYNVLIITCRRLIKRDVATFSWSNLLDRMVSMFLSVEASSLPRMTQHSPGPGWYTIQLVRPLMQFPGLFFGSTAIHFLFTLSSLALPGNFLLAIDCPPPLPQGSKIFALVSLNFKIKE